MYFHVYWEIANFVICNGFLTLRGKICDGISQICDLCLWITNTNEVWKCSTIYDLNKFWWWMMAIAKVVSPPPGIIQNGAMKQVNRLGEDNLNDGHDWFLVWKKIRTIIRPSRVPAIFWESDFYLNSLMYSPWQSTKSVPKPQEFWRVVLLWAQPLTTS